MDVMRIFLGHSSPLIMKFFLFSLIGLILPSCSTTSKNFPADIVLAAYGESNKETRHTGRNKTLPIEGELQCLLGKSDFNDATSSDDSVLKAAVAKAMNEGASNDDREEIAKAIELIKTGQFYRDILSVVAVSSDVIPQIKRSIVSDFRKPKLVSCGIKAPIRDLLDHETKFSNALGCIYESPTGKEAGETARILLKNESVRLAIIVYARANGINLNESDLDTFRETALNTENPDLGPLVEVGVVRLKEEYGVDKIETLLTKMNNNQFECGK